MDEYDASDFGSDYESLPDTSQASKTAFSGIKLVLPSLSSVKTKGKPKKKNGKDKAKGPPRPQKLKPLKEVLSGLMVRMKKKDDYALFLNPVDVSQVPGYADIIKQPMDLGTMSAKVDRGRYRSLDEFADDLRLVTGNAKLFNPPGNLFHTEAERLESFSLSIINKARGTVLQYETDWNIDVEGDETVELEETYEPEPSTPVLTTDSRASYEPTEVEFGLRRRTRAPAQRAESKQPTVSESIDAEGRMPGSKDGLGAFSAGSDWANMMLALKLRGKRYKTKKERMKIEKDGPPYKADGSLDYTALEDPISVLTPLIPEPLPSPLRLLEGDATKLLPKQTQPSHRERYGTYFTLVRNAPRMKQRDADVDEPPALVERQANTMDLGSLSLLAREVDAELQRREIFSDESPEERATNHIRESLDVPTAVAGTEGTYWTRQRARTAEEYIRDVVYGGVDGQAYVRSLAEFVQCPSTPKSQAILTKHVEDKILPALTENRHTLLRATADRLSQQQKLDPKHPLDAQIAKSLLIPTALRQLPAIWEEKIDLGVLVKSPEELATLEGKNTLDLGSDILSRSLGTLAHYIVKASSKPPVPDPKPLSLLVKSEDSNAMQVDQPPPKVTYALAHENLRLQLLALVKRAPVDALGSVPPHLLPKPEHIKPANEASQSETKMES